LSRSYVRREKGISVQLEWKKRGDKKRNLKKKGYLNPPRNGEKDPHLLLRPAKGSDHAADREGKATFKKFPTLKGNRRMRVPGEGIRCDKRKKAQS